MTSLDSMEFSLARRMLLVEQLLISTSKNTERLSSTVDLLAEKLAHVSGRCQILEAEHSKLLMTDGGMAPANGEGEGEEEGMSTQKGEEEQLSDAMHTRMDDEAGSPPSVTDDRSSPRSRSRSFFPFAGPQHHPFLTSTQAKCLMRVAT